MSLRLLLPMTVLAVLTAAVFSPNLRADNGVVTMSKAPYYYVTQGAKRQHPNPKTTRKKVPKIKRKIDF